MAPSTFNSGTFSDMFSAGEPGTIGWCLEFPCLVIDLPLCLVLDTVALPVDAAIVWKNKDKKDHNNVPEDTPRKLGDPQN